MQKNTNKRKGLISSVLVAFTFGAGLQLTVAGEPIVKKISKKENSAKSWTEADYRSAKPMTMPLSDNPGLAVDRFVNDIVGDGSRSKSRSGKSPVSGASKKVIQIFTPDTASTPPSTSTVVPFAVGTEGAHYTSSRINPTSIRTTFPYSTVGRLFFTTTSGGNGSCSASVIGRRIVLTAGHCVHNHNGSPTGFYTNFRFIPAYENGSGLGEFTAKEVLVSDEWYNGTGAPNSDDYAILIMNDTRSGWSTKVLGDVTGYLGWATNAMNPNHLTVLGYPCNLDNCSIMHVVNAEILAYREPNTYTLGSDMRHGASGGPWVQNFGVVSTGQDATGNNKVVSVLSYGSTSTLPHFNGGSQLDSTFEVMWNKACSVASNCN